MLATGRTAIACLAAFGITMSCGSGAKTAPEAPPAQERPSLSDFSSAVSVLPPAPLAIAWADVDAIRQGPASQLLEELDGGVPVPEGAGTSFFKDNLESIHRLAGGIWVTLGGPSLFVALEGDFTTETLFTTARQWAEAREAKAVPCKVRGRPGLRVGDTVLVDAGSGMFLNGPESLATRTLELMDRKNTGSAMTPQLAYLAAHTIQENTSMVISGIAPPSSTNWLQKKNLQSVVGSRFLLAVRTPGHIDLRLGLLPGKPIKPIWFAQEVNTFLVRAAKDPSIVKLGLGDWVEGLDVELLSKGIVVRGSLKRDKLLEVVQGGGS